MASGFKGMFSNLAKPGNQNESGHKRGASYEDDEEVDDVPTDNNKSRMSQKKNSNTNTSGNEVVHNKVQEMTTDEKEFILKMEMKVRKEKEQMKASHSVRKQMSKYSQFVLGDQYNEEEKEKMGLASTEFRNPNLPCKEATEDSHANETKNVTSLFIKSKIKNLIKLLNFNHF
jgi:hypothetical protein